MRRTCICFPLLLAFFTFCVGPGILPRTVLGRGEARDEQTKKPKKDPASVLDFKVKDIDGKEVSLSSFRGQVLMVVNVASQ